VSLLRAAGVRATLGRGHLATEVLHGVDLEVRGGELVLLMGPSGSGKTTLLSILAGLLRPTSGTVTLSGHVLDALDEGSIAALRRRHVGFVFQTHNLFPALDAAANVALAFRMRGASPALARERARAALADVGLSDRADHLPRELSTGQQQRVAIARALAGDPPVVLGDEITASLDAAHAVEAMELLRRRIGPRSAALLVTHDGRLRRFADRVIVLDDGRVAPTPPAREDENVLL
jgi:putative ABC transport system ATP-binding protein